MHESLTTSSVSAARPLRFRASFSSFPTHVEQIEAEQAAFYAWQCVQRRKQSLRWWGMLWPIALGAALGLAAPLLYALMVRFEPWGMWLVFPFALIAGRPELHIENQLVGNLPLLALYAQFPVEGLLARLSLGRRVTVPGIAGQVFYFHYLAGLQILMLSGAVTHALVH